MRWRCVTAVGKPGWKKHYDVAFSRSGAYAELSVSLGTTRSFVGSGLWDDESCVASLQDVACAIVADAYGSSVSEVRECLPLMACLSATR